MADLACTQTRKHKRITLGNNVVIIGRQRNTPVLPVRQACAIDRGGAGRSAACCATVRRLRAEYMIIPGYSARLAWPLIPLGLTLNSFSNLFFNAG